MSYYLIAIFTLLVSYILYKCYIYPIYLSPLHKIPGPPVDNFFFGHLTSLLSDKQGEVFIHLEKQYGGIVRYHTLWNKPNLLIFDQKLVQQIMISRSYDFAKYFLNAQARKDLTGSNGLPFVEGNAHKRQRRLVNPSFTLDHSKEMLPILVQTGHKLIDVLLKQIGDKKEERITITEIAPKVALDVIGLAGFNYDFESISSDSDLSQAYRSYSSANISPFFIEILSFFPSIKKILTLFSNNKDPVKVIKNTAEKLMAERKNATIQRKDFLSLVIKSNENVSVDEKLTHNELLSLVMTILIAGHESVGVSLSWALYYLAKYPDIQDHLRKEILDEFTDCDHPTFEEVDNLKYLECVIKESLRINPPSSALMRCNTKDEIMNGYFIPKGTPLTIPVYPIHYNPLIWGDDAESFNPSRWLNPELKSQISSSNYLPFGGGGRFCLGTKFALLEFKYILLILIKNFKFGLVEGFTFKKLTNGFCRPHPGIDLLISKVNN